MSTKKYNFANKIDSSKQNRVLREGDKILMKIGDEVQTKELSQFVQFLSGVLSGGNIVNVTFTDGNSPTFPTSPNIGDFLIGTDDGTPTGQIIFAAIQTGEETDSSGWFTISGGSQNLQQVTDIGYVTTNDIQVRQLTSGNENDFGAIRIYDEHNKTASIVAYSTLGADLTFTLPTSAGIIPVSVNGNVADPSGNITVEASAGIQEDTYANWDSARLAGELPKGAWIRITDRLSLGAYLGIDLFCETESTFRVWGMAGFYNMDFANIGTDVSATGTIPSYSEIETLTTITPHTVRGVWNRQMEYVTANYSGGIGTPFTVGDTITQTTGANTGATATVISDGMSLVYVKTSVLDFEIGETIDNGDGATGALSFKSMSINEGDIFFWNNRHLQLIDITKIIGNNPSVSTDAYTGFGKGNDIRGYIQEWDAIEYDFIADKILRRNDKRGNSISFTSLDLHQWGDPNIINCFCNEGIFASNTLKTLNNKGKITGRLESALANADFSNNFGSTIINFDIKGGSVSSKNNGLIDGVGATIININAGNDLAAVINVDETFYTTGEDNISITTYGSCLINANNCTGTVKITVDNQVPTNGSTEYTTINVNNSSGKILITTTGQTHNIDVQDNTGSIQLELHGFANQVDGGGNEGAVIMYLYNRSRTNFTNNLGAISIRQYDDSATNFTSNAGNIGNSIFCKAENGCNVLISLNEGIEHQDCKYGATGSFTFPIGVSYTSKELTNSSSSFFTEVDITSLTTLNVTSGNNFAGILFLISDNPAETINIITNAQTLFNYSLVAFPDNLAVTIHQNHPRSTAVSGDIILEGSDIVLIAAGDNLADFLTVSTGTGGITRQIHPSILND